MADPARFELTTSAFGGQITDPNEDSARLPQRGEHAGCLNTQRVSWTKKMKITEIVGSYADPEEPDSSLLQNIASAFTRSGKVKRPLDQQLPDGQPIAGYIPFSSRAASDEDPAVDAISTTSTDAPIIRTTQILRPPRCTTPGPAGSLARDF